MDRIYLDHNATTPVHPAVAAAVARIYAEVPGNPSSIHAEGRAARAAVEDARERVARYFHADPDDVVFTSGGTEADNLGVIGPMWARRRDRPSVHAVVTAIEHSAVLRAANRLEADGVPVTRVLPERDGRLDPDRVLAACRPDTVLASCMAVNNETGVLQPIEALGTALRARGVLFHVDAVQACAKLPIDWRVWPVDLLSVSAHKVYGPKGTGALLVRRGTPLEPRSLGGGHESGRRGGTENVAGVVGFATALELDARGQLHDLARLAAWRDRLWAAIRAALPEAQRNGDPAHVVAPAMNVRFTGLEADTLNMRLDLDGLAVSAGSACASGAPEPSHVLLAMGLTKREAKQSLRLSVGASNDDAQIDRACAVFADAIAAVRAVGAR